MSGWRVAKSIGQLRKQVDVAAPGRSTASDGMIGDVRHATSRSDHNPWVKDAAGTGVVTAIDITHDPAKGCDAGMLAAALVASRDPRIKYIIYNRRIVSATVQPWVWRAYGGSNPHTKHVHLSVVAEARLFDAETPWALCGAWGVGVDTAREEA